MSQFQLDGVVDGIEFHTVVADSKYTTTFKGKGVEGQFTFYLAEIGDSKNPLEVLHGRVFHSDLPDQSKYNADQVFETPTYFV